MSGKACDNRRPPFWGLNLSLAAGAQVLVVDDQPEERRPVLGRLLGESEVTWATNIKEVRTALELHGPFDIYCLDYDLDGDRGGWFIAGELIREHDPKSVAKVVLIHSSNIDARAYFSLFPAAICIQWDVLATILGLPLVDHALIDAVLDEAGHDATAEDLREAALKFLGDQAR